MGVGVTLATILILVFILMGSGLYIALALSGAAIFGLHFFSDTGNLVGAAMYNMITSYTLAAVPMFIFMGEIILRTGLSQRLYNGVSRWTRIIPGGLVHSNILSCSLFAAVSGSSVATAATIGTVAYTEQREKGYEPTIITGSLVAGGTLGILIPPSLIMIIYGSFVGASVARLFIGGIIPGIILASLFMIYIFISFVSNPSLGPPRQAINPKQYIIDAIISVKDIWPTLLLIVAIMGGIYTGIMTPTEASAIACLLAIVLALVLRRLNFETIKKAAVNAIRTTSMLLFITLGGYLLSQALSMAKIPAQLCTIIAATGLERHWIWIGVIFVYLLLGCFMEGIAMMVMTLPVTFPLMIDVLGYNPIWFGVLLTILVECALITPPVGLNLYVISNIAKDTTLARIIKGSFPFFLIILVGIALFTFFPDLVLFLPGQMFGD